MPFEPVRVEDRPSPRPEPAGVPAWALLGWPALAALLAFGVGLSAPLARPPAPLPVVSLTTEVPSAAALGSLEACPAPGLVLPPGHPPVSLPGVEPRLRLPPGHPPIEGQSGRLGRPWPQGEAAPALVDL
jgi:hypothetical protein